MVAYFRDDEKHTYMLFQVIKDMFLFYDTANDENIWGLFWARSKLKD